MPQTEKPAKISLLVLGFQLGLTGCGSSLPPLSLEGTWTGTLTDSIGRPGTASLILSEDRHGILNGSFSYLASNCNTDDKRVIAKIAAMQVSLSQAAPDPVLTSFQLAVSSTDQQLTGTYSDTNGNCV